MMATTPGQRLKSARESRGWSQTDLMREIKARVDPTLDQAQAEHPLSSLVHQTVLSRIEQGTRAMRVGEAVILSRVLGCTLEWLATGEPETSDRYNSGYKDGVHAARRALTKAMTSLEQE